MIVVVDDLTGDRRTGVVEVAEQGLVEEFVPHPAVECLEDAVLHRSSGSDGVPLDAGLLRPEQDGIRGEPASPAFGSVPSSLTTSLGLPYLATSVVSSRATRLPEIDVSGMAARHCLVTSSMTSSTRNR